ncbi:B3 domain-containing protein Os03g0212300-like [Lolium perenne]|uniref:B3 domain-containing protein Os03g0212300-like n=1 Tax=Lolium perenne TaxID=4522 RepID=UPI0021F67708|nr:B3 domain-containing protein Os03g0212300-like [Lolium perenne]
MDGPGGQRGGRGRRHGRGRRVGAASPRRSPSLSSSQESRCFEFILCIDENPLGIKLLPDKFAEFVDGTEPAELQLREGKMYMHTGWDKFARAHNLEVGCLLTFLYKGDGEMIIKVFDKISCRRYYHTDESEEHTDN